MNWGCEGSAPETWNMYWGLCVSVTFTAYPVFLTCFRTSGVCVNLLMLCNQGCLDYYRIVALSILFMFFIGRMIVTTKACLVFYG